MDIPRIFNISESAHRIHNPLTPEKLATLGAALAAVAGDADELRNEAADLLYHLIVLLRESGLSLEDVRQTLVQRHAASESAG